MSRTRTVYPNNHRSRVRLTKGPPPILCVFAHVCHCAHVPCEVARSTVREGAILTEQPGSGCKVTGILIQRATTYASSGVPRVESYPKHRAEDEPALAVAVITTPRRRVVLVQRIPLTSLAEVSREDSVPE